MTDGDVAVKAETTMAPEGAIVVFAVLLAALSAVALRAYRVAFRARVAAAATLTASAARTA
ncbi:hypothetical protein QFZ91_008048 [Paraburkholderia sp. JPY419]